MKFLCLVLLLPSLALSTPSQKLSIQVQFWSQDCSKSIAGEASNCEIPKALGAEKEEILEWREVTLPGEASINSIKIQSPSTKELAKLSLFHVFPKLESGLPRYVQIRWEWILPNRGLCIESVRQRNPLELPPIMCAVWDSAQMKMIGATFKFKDLSGK